MYLESSIMQMGLLITYVVVKVYRPLTDQIIWSGSFSLVDCASDCCAGDPRQETMNFPAILLIPVTHKRVL